MTTWALIDYENVTNLEELKLESYERILLFCGKNNKRLHLDQLPQTGFHHFEILRLQTLGKNNLDFHLTFQLGRLHEHAGPDIAFHIISRDQGFDGLLHHLKSLGRRCKRVGPPVKLSQDAERIRKLLEECPEASRPGSQAKLESWIANKFNNRKTPPVPANLIKRLQQAHCLKIKEGKVEYTFGV
jgi:hypothetical protein